MWPGQQQPGGEQNPQQPNPYQQPEYQRPNPYQQPGAQQPGAAGQPTQPGYPNPYAQQPGPQWHQPAGTGGPMPPQGGGGRSKATWISVVVAVVVVAAAAVGAYLVLGKDDKGGEQADSKPSQKTGSGGDAAGKKKKNDGRTPVVPGWQSVRNPKHYAAFDVPKTSDWDVGPSGSMVPFGGSTLKPLVVMSGPASYKSDYCGKRDLGTFGTKGGQGSKNTKQGASVAANNFAYAAYDEKSKGKHIKGPKTKPFHNSHGISGHYSVASVSGAPKRNKCGMDGKVYSVSWINANGDIAIWVGMSSTGVKGEVSDATFKKIMGSLRNIGSPGEYEDPRG